MSLRWFVGLNMDDAVWDVTVFTKNRDRLLKAEVARKFFDLVAGDAKALDLMSDEHFTVDGTLLEVPNVFSPFWTCMLVVTVEAFLVVWLDVVE